MKLGIGLPNALAPAVNRGLLLDWAREADQAGFHAFGTIDHPGYETWDPLISLAAAAAVTERVRLATTILQLPNRSELAVAQQAATIDRLSGGRLDLGVAIGGRESDYAALGAKMKGRGRKIERQIRKMRKVWRQARRATDEAPSVVGPAPIQKPGIPIWIGGSVTASRARAVKLGDGFIYGRKLRPSPETKAEIVELKEQAAAEKKKRFQVAAVRYVVIGDADAVDQAFQLTDRYYGGIDTSPDKLFVHGGPDEVLAVAKEYEDLGIDVLYLFPQVPDVRQVTMLGEHVLPAFRVPG